MNQRLNNEFLRPARTHTTTESNTTNAPQKSAEFNNVATGIDGKLQCSIAALESFTSNFVDFFKVKRRRPESTTSKTLFEIL